jgi:hypothetical protein
MNYAPKLPLVKNGPRLDHLEQGMCVCLAALTRYPCLVARGLASAFGSPHGAQPCPQYVTSKLQLRVRYLLAKKMVAEPQPPSTCLVLVAGGHCVFQGISSSLSACRFITPIVFPSLHPPRAAITTGHATAAHDRMEVRGLLRL